MATYIKTSGECLDVKPESEDFWFDDTELQEYVHGQFDILPFWFNKKLMVINHKNLDVNMAASIIYGNTILGDVLVCNLDEIK